MRDNHGDTLWTNAVQQSLRRCEMRSGKFSTYSGVVGRQAANFYSFVQAEAAAKIHVLWTDLNMPACKRLQIRNLSRSATNLARFFA